MYRNRLVLGLTMVFLVFLAGCSSDKEDTGVLQLQDTTVTSDFTTETVQLGDYVEQSSFPGTVTYFSSDSLKFTQDSGVFGNFYVEEGQRVKKGDILADCVVKISESELTMKQLELEALQAELAQQTKLYESDLAELTSLAQENPANEELYSLISKRKTIEFEQYRKTTNVVITELEAEITETNGAKSSNQIIAPYDGVIDKLAYINEGSSVDADRWIVQMHSESELLIQVTDSKEQLAYNMEVIVEADLDGNRQTYLGHVMQSDCLLDSSMKTGKAFIMLDDTTVLAGEFTNVLVYADTAVAEQVLTVSRGAVYTEKGKKYILLYENELMKKRYVTIGLNGADRVVLLTGADEGMQVIVR